MRITQERRPDAGPFGHEQGEAARGLRCRARHGKPKQEDFEAGRSAPAALAAMPSRQKLQIIGTMKTATTKNQSVSGSPIFQ